MSYHASRPRPLFLAAFEREVASLLSHESHIISKSFEWGAEVREVIRDDGVTYRIGWSGMGPEQAEKAARWMARCFPTTVVILTGYAGATLPDEKPGQLVLASEVRRKGRRPLTPTAGRSGKLGEVLKTLSPLEGVIETLDEPLFEPAQKEEKGRAGISAVEMETHPAAVVFTEAGIPWFSLRVILDSTAHSLRGVDSFTTPEGGVRPLALAGAILRDPALIGRLMVLGKAQKTAAASLEKALNEIAHAL